MADIDDERKALGQRMAAARKLAGFTLEGAAKALTESGRPITKQAVGHWESGRNLPDALWLRRLAKLYDTSVDAMLWAESLSPEAMKIAVEYDHLTDAQRSAWRLLWLGYITRAAEGGELLPPAPQSLFSLISREEPDH
jgi:transcriptional regulator with XRE-family HTH domain